MKTVISMSALHVPTASDVVDGLVAAGIPTRQINQDVKVENFKCTFSISTSKPVDLAALSRIADHVDNVSSVWLKASGHDIEVTVNFL